MQGTNAKASSEPGKQKLVTMSRPWHFHFSFQIFNKIVQMSLNSLSDFWGQHKTESRRGFELISSKLLLFLRWLKGVRSEKETGRETRFRKIKERESKHCFISFRFCSYLSFLFIFFPAPVFPTLISATKLLILELWILLRFWGLIQIQMHLTPFFLTLKHQL